MKSDRLYTWTDVQNEIFWEMKRNCPDGLIEVRVFWDGLHAVVKRGKEEDIAQWIENIFEGRFKRDQNKISLDRISEKERFLETFIEIEEEEDKENGRNIFRPLISKPALLSPEYFKNDPAKLPDNYPPIFAFHSFKGGVGRTIHAIAFALLARSFRNYKVLLVDADLEAPGITLMLEKEKRNLQVSFADMLALVHSDSEEEASEALDLVHKHILNLDNMFILPAFRSSDQIVSLEIKPEHLIKYSDNPYIITDILSKLGKRLGADVVIADLRAGFSEISAGLLLDPRVHRIFVTTLSDQSFTGTLNALEYIGNLSPCIKDYMPQPNVIISMVPEPYRIMIDKYKQDLEKKITDSFSDKGGRPISFPTKLNDGSILNYQLSPIYETPFNNDLFVLPKEWKKVTDCIEKSEIKNAITPLLNKVRKIIMSTVFATNTLGINIYNESIEKKIKDFSNPQKIRSNDFYISDSMRRLAADYADRVPIAVIDGIKGSGKTTFFFYIMRKKSWRTIVTDLIIKNDSEYDPLIIPIVIPSKDYKINQILEKKRTQSVNFFKDILSLDKPPLWNEIWESFCKKDMFSVADWIDYFAWSLGFETGKKGAGNHFLSKLNIEGRDVVFVIDLLDKEYIDEKWFKVLMEVPKWFERQPQRTAGIIIFCNSDISDTVIKKDTEEVFGQYLPYRMKMNQEDIFRFFYFICVKIGLFKEKISDIYQMPINHLIDKIELNLENNRLLTGYHLKAVFEFYKNMITPYNLISFIENLLKAADADSNTDIDGLIKQAADNSFSK